MSDTTQAAGGDATALPTRQIIESDEPMLFAVAGTHHGRTRDANQDTFLCEAAGEFGLYAAIDGVGGYAGGHIAAALARDRIRAHVGRLSSAPEELLREAVVNANNAIVEKSDAEPELSQMACVLTVALVDPQQQRVYAAHVGDTRLYHRQGDTITKLTPDHSFVGLREDAGQISEEEAMQHPRRNEILRDVGSDPRTVDDPDFVFTTDAPFRNGDALLLCSDGLTDLVPHAVLTQALVDHRGDPRRIVNELVHAALEAGGSDNVTAVVVEYSASGAAFAASDTPRARSTDTREFPPDAFTPASDTRELPAAPAPPPSPMETPAVAKGGIPGWVKAAMGLLLLLLVAGAAFIGYNRFVAGDAEPSPEAAGAVDPNTTPALDSPTTDEPALEPPAAPLDPDALASRIARVAPNGRINLNPDSTYQVSALRIPRGVTLVGNGATLQIDSTASTAFDVAAGVESFTVRDLTILVQDVSQFVAVMELQSPDTRVEFDGVTVVGDGTPPVPAVVIRRDPGDARPLTFTLNGDASPAVQGVTSLDTPASGAPAPRSPTAGTPPSSTPGLPRTP